MLHSSTVLSKRNYVGIVWTLCLLTFSLANALHNWNITHNFPIPCRGEWLINSRLHNGASDILRADIELCISDLTRDKAMSIRRVSRYKRAINWTLFFAMHRLRLWCWTGDKEIARSAVLTESANKVLINLQRKTIFSHMGNSLAKNVKWSPISDDDENGDTRSSRKERKYCAASAVEHNWQFNWCKK